MKRFLSVLFVFGFLLVPLVTLAQDASPDATPEVVVDADAGVVVLPDAGAVVPVPVVPPGSDAEAVEVVETAIWAVQNSNWSLLAGLVLFLVVFLANRFGLAKKVGRNAVPWVTAGLGVAGTLGLGLANDVPVQQALMHGFFASAEAIALWELVFRHINDNKSDGTPKEGTVAAPVAPVAPVEPPVETTPEA